MFTLFFSTVVWIEGTIIYSMKKLNLEGGRVTFHRDAEGMSKLQLPDVITKGMLPDDAIFEIDIFMEYILNKYGLK